MEKYPHRKQTNTAKFCFSRFWSLKICVKKMLRNMYFGFLKKLFYFKTIYLILLKYQQQ